ncbi:MAG: ATP-binding protein [Myxococcota bacterium]
MLFGKLAKDLERGDVDALIDNAVSEGRRLDYKLTLPGTKNSDRKEFIDDVCSLANAGGGHMLFGIDEERDASGKSTGRPRSASGLGGINRDQEVLRLDSMILTNISPRIRHRWRFIDGFAEGPVAVLEVDRSWVGPHITTHSASRFPMRGGAGKYHMDIDQIRASFISTASTSERLRSLHEEQIALNAQRDLPIALEGPFRVYVHLLPLSLGAEVGRQIDPQDWGEQRSKLAPLGASGCNYRYNIDGYLTFARNPYEAEQSSYRKAQRSYLQAFRQGTLVSATCRYVTMRDDVWYIPSSLFEKDVMRFVHQKLSVMANVGVELPIVVLVSLVNMRGVRLAISNYAPIKEQGEPIDREALTLPEALFEEVPPDALAAARLLRPLFDGLWQACGHPECLNYDPDGNWRESP